MSKPTDETDFWNGFSAALAKKRENKPTGRGWKSLDDLCAMWRCHRTNASTKAMEGYRAGLVERFVGHIEREGKLVRSSWFRPKKR